ncbi:MAG: amidohydrolase [Betaproteobacteria bacterium]|nr:amidohydrolase [Betaproteobacteria bacterium]
MTLKYGFISADDHVQEHPQVWTKRMSKAQWGDRIPHIERQSDGSECWVVDGKKIDLSGVAIAGAAMADRAREPQRWADVPSVVSSPRERLLAMDADGVDYSVLYPSVAGRAGETFGRLTDPALELACVQAYNDWLIEEWASVSPRFIPQCIVPLAPVDAMVKEIERAVAKGHRGVVLPSVPMMLRDVPHINEPVYDPVWQTCQSLNVPVCFHAGASRDIQFPAYSGFSPEIASALEAITRPVSTVLVVANFLFAQILDRFPKLKVVFAETTLAWAAYELELADHQFERQRLNTEGYDLTPSQLFKRQCHFVGWFDTTGLKTRQHIGLDSILWSTNFPQSTSTWPESRRAIARSFEGIPDNERHQVLAGNAAKLYNVAVH